MRHAHAAKRAPWWRSLLACALLTWGASVAAQPALRYLHPNPNLNEALTACAADFAASGITVFVDAWGADGLGVAAAGGDAPGDAAAGSDGWGRAGYAAALEEAFIIGDAPDVMATEVAHAPAWIERGYLMDLRPRIEASGIGADLHPPGLAAVATHGIPSAWGAVALAYRSEALTRAGITVAALEEAIWDAESGGEFGALLARLTLDAEGRDALDPNFDVKQVVQHGLSTSLGWGPTAVATWGWLAISAGDALGQPLRADDPNLMAALTWLLDQVRRGVATLSGGGAAERIAALQAGAVALTPVGSWDLAAFADSPVALGFARLPLGPAGRGGAVVALGFDAIWAGTAHPDAAWAWLEHLASPNCRNRVAAAGGVLPTAGEATALAAATWAEGGLDASAFLAPSRGWDHPIAGWPRGVDAIMSEVIDAVASGLASPATLLPHARAAIDRLATPP